MDQNPQYPTGNTNPPTAPVNEAGIPQIQNSNGQPSFPVNGGGFQQNPGSNPTELRTKRRMYTFVQIVAVFFLLLSCPLIIISLIEIGPQFGKSGEATATISEIGNDLTGIIAETIGYTDSSDNCRVHYRFTADGRVYNGSIHSSELCGAEIDTPINIVYSPKNPNDNTIAKEKQPYSTMFVVGIILLIGSLFTVIISSILKRKVPKPEKAQQF